MEDFKVKEPDEITIIKITRNGNEVTTDVEHVEGYEPVDPQAMIGALAGAISEYNQYVFSEPKELTIKSTL